MVAITSTSRDKTGQSTWLTESPTSRATQLIPSHLPARGDGMMRFRCSKQGRPVGVKASVAVPRTAPSQRVSISRWQGCDRKCRSIAPSEHLWRTSAILGRAMHGPTCRRGAHALFRVCLATRHFAGTSAAFQVSRGRAARRADGQLRRTLLGTLVAVPAGISRTASAEMSTRFSAHDPPTIRLVSAPLIFSSLC